MQALSILLHNLPGSASSLLEVVVPSLGCGRITGSLENPLIAVYFFLNPRNSLECSPRAVMPRLYAADV